MRYDEIDISSLDFWAQPARRRAKAFAELRAQRPVSYHRPLTFGLGAMMAGEDAGYWAVATHRLVRSCSRNPAVFCSSGGVGMEDVPADFSEAMASFLVMDGERHSTLRRLVVSVFTPRNLARIEKLIRNQARQIVDRLLDIRSGDFVQDVSMQLPMWTISEMIGIPEDERAAVADAANAVVTVNDPELEASAITGILAAQLVLREAAVSLAQRRRAAPQDDLMSALVQAEVDGRTLTDDEIGAFIILLSVAGNDTTRQTTSHAMKALCDHPKQRALFTEDLVAGRDSGVEELIRWATPVIYFRRTATEDVELEGEKIQAGEKVVLLYESANRDETVFPDPWAFDVRREPNDHVSFGGGGPHYCLGAQMARMQLRHLFLELLTRAPGLDVGEPEYLTSNFIHGIKRMQCTV